MGYTEQTGISVNTVHALKVRLLSTFGDHTVYNWTCVCTIREVRHVDNTATNVTFAHRALQCKSWVLLPRLRSIVRYG